MIFVLVLGRQEGQALTYMFIPPVRSTLSLCGNVCKYIRLHSRIYDGIRGAFAFASFHVQIQVYIKCVHFRLRCFARGLQPRTFLRAPCSRCSSENLLLIDSRSTVWTMHASQASDQLRPTKCFEHCFQIFVSRGCTSTTSSRENAFGSYFRVM